MSGVRAFATLLLVGLIALLSVFQMQIRGYEKIERINEWVLYYGSDLVFEMDLLLEPEHYHEYTVKKGFEEKNLYEVYHEEHDLFTQVEWQEIALMIEERELE